MNERMKELAEQAGLKIEFQMTNPPKPFQILGSVEDIEKFGQLIIKEVLAQPKVYLLNVLKATDPDAVWELHGWTNDLKLAQQWREKSSRHERHDFTDLFFVKKIDTLE